MSINQKILPAISNHQALKKFIASDYEYGILMNFQLAQLPELIQVMKDSHKKVLIHSELIKGLSSDEYGAIFLIQNLNVDGIISSKPKVIEVCKKRKVIGIFRFFIKDSTALGQSISLARKIEPQYIEILPSSCTNVIEYVTQETSAQILMGGLIGSKAEINHCIKSGAISVTTSNPDLWI
ncbi:glycerol-3-phosphate responsive antiterminator [Mariniplasma anaerobium]|uniref:Glycerol uptake operon antiterminator regulatory protein n=1 Tax=Mariniplasma anaerobium TaxID=2735436 RepID=A0A7U9XW07_9MOLU|nr:glycerol-3-phosphate responsive antiterminator [Mariniplasma anaerobium]BCR35871.1 glycerol uptake operon antiterminator regulatory protein [Mariniplasma anaerobium]